MEDNLSGIKEVKYLPQTGEAALDASALGIASGWTEVSLSDVTWTPETEKTSGTYSFEFQNTSNQQFRLYVMVTDEAGHTTFIA